MIKIAAFRQDGRFRSLVYKYLDPKPAKSEPELPSEDEVKAAYHAFDNIMISNGSISAAIKRNPELVKGETIIPTIYQDGKIYRIYGCLIESYLNYTSNAANFHLIRVAGEPDNIDKILDLLRKSTSFTYKQTINESQQNQDLDNVSSISELETKLNLF